MRRLLCSALSATAFAGSLWARSSGPPVDHAGIPWPEPFEPKDCTSCHTGFVNTGPGSLALLGLPASYEPDVTYALVVELLDAVRARYGFELAVVDSALNQAGALAPGDMSLTQVVWDASRELEFLEQRAAGSMPGGPDGTTWTFSWTAPATPAGPLSFYVCGLSGDGDGSPRNDRVYCRVASLAGCAALPDPIAGLKLVHDASELQLSWQENPRAGEGYRLYAVSSKEDLPAANQATPGARRPCAAGVSSATSCSLALEPGPLFLQIVGVCSGGIEGPN